MRTAALVTAIVVSLGVAGSAAAGARNDGLVYRYYAGLGYRFNPLLSFGKLNATVSAHRPAAARTLADALLARSARSGNALYWEYDFPFGGGPSRWTSGFAQAVAAQALARTAVLLGAPRYADAAAAAFRGLRRTLLIRIGGGSWVREYSFTGQVILNAQLESVLALDWYASLAGTGEARRVADDLRTAARALLPRFDLGCWGRYQLGGPAADTHYETYHVELLRRLAARHPEEPLWRRTYVRWARCVR